MLKRLVLPAVAVALLCSTVPAAAQAATYTKAVRYGPYSLPAATDPMAGSTVTQLKLAVRRPCSDCYITSFKPDLVYEDGTRATMENGAMLHHFVLTSQFRSDATCSNDRLGLAGERFFASGNERTAIAFPAGYGYRVRWYDSWNLLVDLMNHTTSPKTVYVEVTFTYRPSWESVRRVRPVWLDIDQCGDSEYSIPAGYSDTHWNWNVNVPGRVVAAIGHVHGHGIAVYGWPQLYDVAEAYALPPSVRAKLFYCGYIVRDLPTLDPGVLRRQHGLPQKGQLVLATVGSCYDGDPLLEAALSAVERLQSKFPDLHAILVTGPFMPPDQQAFLQARTSSTCRVLSRADNFQLMSAADVIVSMGGYNSVCEALALARPLVIVPRATHKIEQEIRAGLLAARGLARSIHPKELNPASLAHALEWALRCDRQAHTQQVREIIPAFDGARRLTAYLSQWLGGG